MKKLYFLLFTFLMFSIIEKVNAQSYTLDSGNTLTVNLGFNAIDYGKIYFTNNSSQNLDLKFTKIEEDTIPGSWFDLCVNANCFVGIPDTGNFYAFPVLPGQKGFLAVHFWTGSTAGISKARVYIYESSNPSGGDTLSFIMNIASLSNINSLDKSNIVNIYPSLVRENLNIDFVNNNADGLYFLKIINAFGQIVHTENISPINKNRINLESFSSGIYFVQINNNKKEIIDTKKIIINK